MNVEEISIKIKDMTIRGAGRIARHASLALKDYSETFDGQDLEEFIGGLDKAAARLISTRPTAISLFNGVQITIRGVNEQPDLESARQMVISNSDTFCE